MANILITGGAGFIGSCLADKLVEDSDNFVLIVDNLLTGHMQKLPSAEYKNWRFIKCDVNDYADISSIFYAHHFDYVFHYAALVGVKRTLDNPILVLRDIKGIENILNLSKNTHVKRVFYSSSSEVYGEPVEFPQRELTTPLNSRLPYAVVKNIAEAYMRSYKQEYNLDYTIFRFFNTYGPKQSRDFVMSKFISAALNNQDITIYGNGSQTRTFCYIDDNIDATVNAFKNNLCVNDVANIGSNIETSVLDLAKIIVEIVGSSSKIVHLPPLQEGDMTRRNPDNTKMKELLNREMTVLKDGIWKVIQNGNFGH
ncbi:epimerase [Adhaeribacter arboris]|uniref:UDP-glucuronate decarboxylase n=1 Tax=Adhaeribacter arboris TaxID=2072846 RepID=A0A2T2Y976_9BACT|nr:GDP-mannose 4,6-dehydratase [Adhaeribacter arboris]PSR52065.1 epimerase [Adhaeribacter arboris]